MKPVSFILLGLAGKALGVANPVPHVENSVKLDERGFKSFLCQFGVGGVGAGLGAACALAWTGVGGVACAAGIGAAAAGAASACPDSLLANNITESALTAGSNKKCFNTKHYGQQCIDMNAKAISTYSSGGYSYSANNAHSFGGITENTPCDSGRAGQMFCLGESVFITCTGGNWHSAIRTCALGTKCKQNGNYISCGNGGGGGGKGDWQACHKNSECNSGCCSNAFAGEKIKYKCAPANSKKGCGNW
ncbi:hypothetical protein HDU86_001353 [Geranomyces michiganensis]|nr:hypothetical protein HDU86_001353 [Geranomyces michiganensis]